MKPAPSLPPGAATVRAIAARGLAFVAEPMEERILHSADITPLHLADAMAATVLLQNAQLPAEVQTQPNEIAFVDATLTDSAALLADLRAQAAAGRPIEVVTIEAGQDGLAVIGSTLAGRHDVTAIHVLAHGSDGVMQLGGARLDADTLLQRAGEVAAWGAALSADADILLYGCDLAETTLGQGLVRDLASLTGADVAASTDTTGAAARGGNWTLEMQTGAIQAALAPSMAEQAHWQGLMATYTADPTKADGAIGSLRWAITQANLNPGADTIQLLAGTHTLTLANPGGIGEDLNTSGDLDVLDGTSFVGASVNAADTVIMSSGTATDRVFDLFSGSVSFQNLTVQGGSNVGQGGGININQGVSVTLSNVVLSNNAANSRCKIMASVMSATWNSSKQIRRYRLAMRLPSSSSGLTVPCKSRNSRCTSRMNSWKCSRVLRLSGTAL